MDVSHVVRDFAVPSSVSAARPQEGIALLTCAGALRIRCTRTMGWRQMSMRGLAKKAQGEWSSVTMAWNIKRMYVRRAA